jgi:hypothetical protein
MPQACHVLRGVMRRGGLKLPEAYRQFPDEVLLGHLLASPT